MRFIFIILFSLSFTLRSQAEAWDDFRVYHATKEACTQIKASSLTGAEMDKMRAGYFRSSEFTSLLQYLSSRSAQTALADFDYQSEIPEIISVLNSPLFEKALLECYPRSPEMRNFFRKSVRDSRLRGRGAAAIFTLISAAGGGYLLSGAKLFGLAIGKALNYALLLLGGIVAADKVFYSFETRNKVDLSCGIDGKTPNREDARSKCLAEIGIAKFAEVSRAVSASKEADSQFLNLLNRSNELHSQISSLNRLISLESAPEKVAVLKLELEVKTHLYSEVEHELRKP